MRLYKFPPLPVLTTPGKRTKLFKFQKHAGMYWFMWRRHNAWHARALDPRRQT